MPNDSVILAVGNTRIDKFISYQVDHDIYEPEGSFSFTCDPLLGIKKGMTCRIFINEQLEMTGIVDTVTRRMSRSGPSMDIVGRSIASILTDSCITNFKGKIPTTLPALVDRLIKDLPFISRKSFIFNAGSDKVKVKKDFIDLSPGDTVFDVLKRAANSQGYIFWVSPAGNFVVDKPKEIGEPKVVIHDSAKGVQYIEGENTESIANGHSDIIVIGECQTDSGDYKTVKAVLNNPSFPYKKPLVITWNDNDGPAAKTAALHLANEKSEEQTLTYSMNGHSQNGKNWQINEFCKVVDRYNDVDGTYLIVHRGFSQARREGKKTSLVLEKGGRL